MDEKLEDIVETGNPAKKEDDLVFGDIFATTENNSGNENADLASELIGESKLSKTVITERQAYLAGDIIARSKLYRSELGDLADIEKEWLLIVIDALPSVAGQSRQEIKEIAKAEFGQIENDEELTIEKANKLVKTLKDSFKSSRKE